MSIKADLFPQSPEQEAQQLDERSRMLAAATLESVMTAAEYVNERGDGRRIGPYDDYLVQDTDDSDFLGRNKREIKDANSGDSRYNSDITDPTIDNSGSKIWEGGSTHKTEYTTRRRKNGKDPITTSVTHKGSASVHEYKPSTAIPSSKSPKELANEKFYKRSAQDLGKGHLSETRVKTDGSVVARRVRVDQGKVTSVTQENYPNEDAAERGFSATKTREFTGDVADRVAKAVIRRNHESSRPKRTDDLPDKARDRKIKREEGIHAAARRAAKK